MHAASDRVAIGGPFHDCLFFGRFFGRFIGRFFGPLLFEGSALLKEVAVRHAVDEVALCVGLDTESFKDGAIVLAEVEIWLGLYPSNRQRAS